MSYQKKLNIPTAFCSGAYFLLNLGMEMHRDYLSLASTVQKYS